MNKNNDLILHFFNRLLNKSRGSREILALLSGCAFPLAFAPFNLWPVAILVIMMLMLSLEGASRREGVLRFYLFGIGMYGVGNWWIYHSIHVYGGASPVLAFSMMTLLVLAYALHAALHGYIYMRFFHDRRWAVPVVFPVLWVLQEWVRTWLLTGFPWFFAGYTQMDTPLAGYAPVLGVMGVSLMLLVAISFLYSLLAGKTSVRWAAAVFLIVWLAGALLQQLPFVTPTAEKLSVSLLQGNVDQRTKWRRESVVPILKLYREMTRDELGRDIIVWPEASITLLRENAGRYLDEMDALASENGSTIILGLPDRDPVSHRFYNTAMALGKGEGNYFKRRLVPFGEYVPLESLLRGLIQAFDLPMSRNEVGPERQPGLSAGPYTLSMSICYEIIYPELVRNAVPDPDLLVTISNDTWFGESIGPKQHLQMARMRALELGRYLLRATNNGETALVDARGKIYERAPFGVKTVLRGEVQVMKGKTPYAVLGDWPVLLFCMVALLMVVSHPLVWRQANQNAALPDQKQPSI